MLIIYTKKITPRFTYAAKQIFERILNIPFYVSDSYSNNNNSNSFVVYYGIEDANSTNIIYNSGLCEKEGIEVFTPVLSSHLDKPVYFLNQHKSNDYNIDIFSLVFYFLSRYEEYLPSQKDKHERFTAKASISAMNHHLDFPIVDYWVRHFGEYLLSEFPDLKIPNPEFQFIPSFDIDHAWKFKNKGLVRNTGGFFRDLMNGKYEQLKERFKVLSGKLADPYDTFEDINETHKSFELIYFILLGSSHRLDINISSDDNHFINLLRELALKATLAIQPSYESNINPELLKKEKEKLSKIINKPITKSRQHFLKLNLPETYNQLINAGITEDYTMGYADQMGFRAGTAYCFNWYNLSSESSTDLLIWPFVAMDVAMREYLQLNPKDAFLRLENLKSSIQKSGGNLILVWHNSSFCEAEGWEDWVIKYKEFLINIKSS